MKADINQLNTKRLQNKHSHKCVVTEEDYKRIMPKIEMLKRLSEVERSLYAVYDMNRNNYLLKSEEQNRLFGISEKDINIDSEIHYQNIHPDDLSFVLETDNMVYRFFSELPADEKKNFKLVYDFRTKNTEGIYRRYMHQTIILEQDKNGKAWLTLVISDMLSEKAAAEKPQRRMINMKTGKLHLFNVVDSDSNSVKLLTNRETEVLSLIGSGYDSINISDKLNISVNTVNNHRQNILRKTNTENTTQALLYCKRLGII
jgi:DNA-binding CsgD family transcriptional regulator